MTGKHDAWPVTFLAADYTAQLILRDLSQVLKVLQQESAYFTFITRDAVCFGEGF